MDAVPFPNHFSRLFIQPDEAVVQRRIGGAAVAKNHILSPVCDGPNSSIQSAGSVSSSMKPGMVSPGNGVQL